VTVDGSSGVRRRSSRPALAALCVGTLLSVVLGTGCAPPDRTAEYLDDLAEVTEQMTNDTFTALPPGAAPTHEQVAEVVDARRRALNAIERLEPPGVLKPEHQVLLLALAGLVDAGTAFLEETAALEPQTFLERLNASIEIDALADRVARACDAMRLRAQDLQYPVGLAC
jgi:hypothetical protein